MSLFINTNNGPIYSDCNVTIINGETTPAEPNHAQTPSADKLQPEAQDVLETPREGKYSEVRKYIEERKRFDEEFKTFCQERSLRELCKRLTNEFGWFVDENSLQKNLNRNR